MFGFLPCVFLLRMDLPLRMSVAIMRLFLCLTRLEVQEQEMSEPFFGLALDLDLCKTGLGATNEEGGKHSILFQWHLPPDLVSRRKRISNNICFRTKLKSVKIHVLILLLTKGARLTIGRRDCQILLRPRFCVEGRQIERVECIYCFIRLSFPFWYVSRSLDFLRIYNSRKATREEAWPWFCPVSTLLS